MKKFLLYLLIAGSCQGSLLTMTVVDGNDVIIYDGDSVLATLSDEREVGEFNAFSWVSREDVRQLTIYSVIDSKAGIYMVNLGLLNPFTPTLLNPDQWLYQRSSTGTVDDSTVNDIDALLVGAPALVLGVTDQVLIPDLFLNSAVFWSIRGWVDPDDTGTRRYILGNSEDYGIMISFLDGEILLETSSGNILSTTTPWASGFAGYRVTMNGAGQISMWVFDDVADYLDDGTGTSVGSVTHGSITDELTVFDAVDNLGASLGAYKGAVADFVVEAGLNSFHWRCSERSRSTLWDVDSTGPNINGQLVVASLNTAWGGDQSDIHDFLDNGGTKIVDFGIVAVEAYTILPGVQLIDDRKFEMLIKWGSGNFGHQGNTSEGFWFRDFLSTTSGEFRLHTGGGSDWVDVTDMQGKWVKVMAEAAAGDTEISIDFLDDEGYISYGFTGDSMEGSPLEEDFHIGATWRGPYEAGILSWADIEFGWARYADTSVGDVAIGEWFARDAYDLESGVAKIPDRIGTNDAILVGTHQFNFYPARIMNDNNVPNGSFNSGLTSWTDQTSGTRSVSAVAEAGADGGNALELIDTSASGSGTINDTITIHPFTDYSLSVRLKINVGELTQGDLVFDTNGDFDDTVQFTHAIDDGDWYEFSGDFNSGPNTTVKIRCFGTGDYIGTGYFDKIEMIAHDEGNIVLNPSIELGTPPDADDWDTPHDTKVYASTDEARGGSASIKVDGTSGSVRRMEQTLSIQTDTYYEFSFWANTLLKTAGALTVDTTDVFDGTCQFYISATHDWTRYKGVFFSGSETDITIRVLMQTDHNGDSYLDDFQIRPLYTTPIGVDEVTNPAATAANIHNNGPSLVIQDEAIGTVLKHSDFWDSGGTYKAMGYGDFKEHLSHEDAVWTLWTSIGGFCMLNAVLTTPASISYNQYLNLVIEKGDDLDCSPGVAPYE